MPTFLFETLMAFFFFFWLLCSLRKCRLSFVDPYFYLTLIDVGVFAGHESDINQPWTKLNHVSHERARNTTRNLQHDEYGCLNQIKIEPLQAQSKFPNVTITLKTYGLFTFNGRPVLSWCNLYCCSRHYFSEHWYPVMEVTKIKKKRYLIHIFFSPQPVRITETSGCV